MVETICTHYDVSKKEARLISLEVLEKLGLVSDQVNRSYPFQLSGGQVHGIFGGSWLLVPIYHNTGVWTAFILFSLSRSFFLSLFVPKLTRANFS
jgi:hypothetical protein